MSDSQKEIIIQTDYLQDEINLLNIHKAVKNNFIALALYDDLRSELTSKGPKDSRSIINKKIQSCFEGVILDLIDQEIPATTQEFMAMLIAKVKQSSIASIVDNIDGICAMYMDTNNFLKKRKYLTMLSSGKADISYRLLKANNIRWFLKSQGIFYDSSLIGQAIEAVLKEERGLVSEDSKKGKSNSRPAAKQQ